MRSVSPRVYIVLFTILVVWAVVPGWTGDTRLPVLGDRANLVLRRVPLDPADRMRTRLGGLTYLGGAELASRDPAFGGFSSLAVRGDRFTLLSDGGNIVRFRLDARWRPRGIAFASLPGGPGIGWDKRDRDSESMAVDPASGRIWVGFEGSNQVWRYAPGFARAETAARPRAMAKWPVNGGAESLVRLRDGRFIAIAETARPVGAGKDRSGRQALVFGGDPTRVRAALGFTFVPPRGFQPADATELPDGRLLILTRGFKLPFSFANRLVIVEPRDIAPGAVVRGTEIAHLAKPLTHDNFEGVAATREGDATIVWLVSDDNETRLQRSLLLKFRLDR